MSFQILYIIKGVNHGIFSFLEGMC